MRRQHFFLILCNVHSDTGLQDYTWSGIIQACVGNCKKKHSGIFWTNIWYWRDGVSRWQVIFFAAERADKLKIYSSRQVIYLFATRCHKAPKKKQLPWLPQPASLFLCLSQWRQSRMANVLGQVSQKTQKHVHDLHCVADVAAEATLKTTTQQTILAWLLVACALWCSIIWMWPDWYFLSCNLSLFCVRHQVQNMYFHTANCEILWIKGPMWCSFSYLDF